MLIIFPYICSYNAEVIFFLLLNLAMMGSFNPYGNGQPNGMNDLFDEEDEDYIEFKRKMKSLHPTLSWGPNPSIIERIFYNSARLLPTGDTYGFKCINVEQRAGSLILQYL